MKLAGRRFAGEADLRAMIALAAASPDRNLHVVDLPYRLCSWALDDPDNVALWVDGRGLLAGWAVLQAPFWTVDLALRPSAETDLFPRILDWMAARTRAAVGTPHGHPTWYVHVFGDQASRLRRLDQAGFACQSDVGENSWSRVLLERRKPLPRTPSHSGFNVRPLRGAAEVQAYVELHRATFGSKNMTAEWRTRTVTAPHHVEDSDLVAVDADGRFAGFCIGWLCRGDTPVGQIEPLGIASAYRERGLGAALLSECVRRLAAHGARTVLVETDTYRTPALGLYESLGFEALRDVLVYRKESANGAADDPEA